MPIPGLKEIQKLPQEWKERRAKKRPGRLKAVAVILLIVCLALGLLGLLTATIAMAWISRDLPNPNTLSTREIPQSTKIYDRTGETLLYEIHGDEKRSLVKIEEIPEVMKQATISIEDRAFYEHGGIYWKGLVRAFTVGFLQNKRVEGTSTLTQQLVKNAILTNERTVTRKVKEILLSFQIERRYTKDQILQMYLNEIPYGSMIYGVGSAAEGYFGKRVDELTLDEAALLAAIPQAPDKWSPYGTGMHGDNRQGLIARQRLILDDMVRDGYITKEQADEAKQIDTLQKLVPRTVGDIKAPHFVMYVRSQLIETYGQKTVEQGGMRVITSLDWEMQQIAEEEVRKGVEKNGEKFGFTNASLVALDPKSGQILSMVGSKDFFDKEIDGQVNVSIRPRQPGSSFKPIVFTAGFIKGYTSETTLWDVLTTFKTDVGPYNPKNYSPVYNGPISVRKALQGSLNIPAVKMLYLVGVGRVLDFAEQLGYTTFEDRSRFGLSLVLGGGEVKLLEHVNAYAAFANQGRQYPITSILKVTDVNNNVLLEWQAPEGKEVVPAAAANEITNVLSDNNARAYVFGTQNFLTLPDRPAAAKTGTTNNFKDAWTLGYVPSLAAGVWVGNSDATEMKSGADGSVIAAPIWQGFMKRALADTPKESFPPMPQLTAAKPVLLGKAFKTTVKIDKFSGKLATEFTPEDLVEEKEFYEAHNILWYLDKDDPMGPAPANPESDPQFANWEYGVQEWVKKNEWHTTSTVPTEYDDIHTADNRPVLNLISPQQNDNLYSRDLTISFNAQTSRMVQSVKVELDGLLIGSAEGSDNQVRVHIPNTVSRGYHDMVLLVRDDIGNTASVKVTINLLADPTPFRVSLEGVTTRDNPVLSDFPINLSLQVNDLHNLQKLDVFYTHEGSVGLVGSVVAPQNYVNIIQWNRPDQSGFYQLYTVAHFTDGSTFKGDTLGVSIGQ